MALKYSSGLAPKGYKCTTYGKHGCQLWREYQTCAVYINLVCCDCAGKSQEVDVSGIDETGKIDFEGMRCDQIGFRVPAVPTEDGDTYWGYTSVPEDGVNWWKRLPTRV